MIGQDRQTAADQHGDKEEIEEVAVANPERKAVRAGKVIGIDRGNGRNMRQAGYGNLNPRRCHKRGKHRARFRSESKDESRGGGGDPGDNERRRVPRQT